MNDDIYENIERNHTAHLTEVLAYPNGFAINHGNTVFLIFFIILFFLSYLIKYPDKISGNAIFTSHSAPIVLVSQTNGKIKLLYKNHSKIQAGETIGYTSDEANFANVNTLYALLKSKDIDKLEYSQCPVLNLGKLSNNWSRFLIELQAYKIYEKSNPEQVGISNSYTQIKKNSKSEANLIDQIKSRETQVDFYKKKLDKDKMLMDKGLISEREYQNSNLQYNEMQNQVKNLRSQLILIDKNNTDYQKQIADYSISKIHIESQKLTSLKQLRINLIEEIEQWYKFNTYRAPFNGSLQYNIPIVDNQFIQQGTELFTITPMNKSEVECNLLIPMDGMGKVAVDQQVIIRLKHYPEEEFGILKGVIIQISPTSITSKTNLGQEKLYPIKVKLNNGLITSYNKAVIYQPNMEGSADIITKDRSLLARIFEQLLKIIER